MGAWVLWPARTSAPGMASWLGAQGGAASAAAAVSAAPGVSATMPSRPCRATSQLLEHCSTTSRTTVWGRLGNMSTSSSTVAMAPGGASLWQEGGRAVSGGGQATTAGRRGRVGAEADPAAPDPACRGRLRLVAVPARAGARARQAERHLSRLGSRGAAAQEPPGSSHAGYQGRGQGLGGPLRGGPPGAGERKLSLALSCAAGAVAKACWITSARTRREVERADWQASARDVARCRRPLWPLCFVSVRLPVLHLIPAARTSPLTPQMSSTSSSCMAAGAAGTAGADAARMPSTRARVGSASDAA